jgi:RNA polymerase sigma factor (sigma-70 family)
MMTVEPMETVDSKDAALVEGSLAGDREAFAQIVARYQSLICSLAYSATGSLAQSEDLAQETFVTAWKQLSSLREPGKLRSWLCGIARNLSYTAVHKESRQPSQAAEPFQALDQTPAREPLPSEQAITREEEAILWRSVEKIPDIYREPLVLYYREHQSIEQVADWLDLSHDAVRQRLSRGRKLLQEQVTAFVEGALERTSPGKAFTLGVLAALPALSLSSQAAAVGAAAAKGSIAAKIPFLSIVSAIVVPVLGVVTGILSVKTSLETAQSQRERRFVITTIWLMGAITLLALVGLLIPIAASESLWRSHGGLLNGMIAAVGVGLPVGILVSVLVVSLRQRRIRREEHDKSSAVPQLTWPGVEYRSRWQLLGLPLIDVQFGTRAGEKRRPAMGWIAIGDAAVGVLVGIGGLSVGIVSIGGLALGGLTLGGLGLGLVGCGGVGIGCWAMGGLALGYVASGSCAVAWLAAQGAGAVAHGFAVGGVALAEHANDAAAREFIASTSFFSRADWFMKSGLFALLCFSPMGLMLWQTIRLRRRMRRGR